MLQARPFNDLDLLIPSPSPSGIGDKGPKTLPCLFPDPRLSFRLRHLQKGLKQAIKWPLLIAEGNFKPPRFSVKS